MNTNSFILTLQLYPETYEEPFHTLLGARNGQKGVSILLHFCCRLYQFLDDKIRFFSLFEAKMNKIVILDQKLIVPDDYQQFWVHFEWFLSLFQISDVK